MDSTVTGDNWTQMTVDSNVTNKLFHAMEKSAMGKYAMVAMVIVFVACQSLK